MSATRQRNLIHAGMGALAALIALLVGWESEWGQVFHRALPAPPSPEPRPVPLILHKEFAPQGGIAAFAEVTARPLLTPTRQPAPPAVAPEPRPTMQRGQYVLMGTMVAGGKSFALLRESNGTKQVRVAQGEKIKSMVVDKVETNQIMLRLGEETETVALKTNISPRRAANLPGPGSSANPGPRDPRVNAPSAGPPAAPPAPGERRGEPEHAPGRATNAAAEPSGQEASANPGAKAGAQALPAGGTWDATLARMRQGGGSTVRTITRN